MKVFKKSIIHLTNLIREHNFREQQIIEDILFNKDQQERSSLYIVIKNINLEKKQDVNEEQK